MTTAATSSGAAENLADGRASALAASPLFQNLSSCAFEDVARRAVRRKLAKGEELFGAREPARAMYLVLAGRVRIWTVSAAGAEITLNILSEGALFGEIGVLDGGERTASASAATPAEVLRIDAATFFDAMSREPQLAKNAIEMLCARLRWVSARMEDSALRSAPERLARLLEHLAQDHGVETSEGVRIDAKFTQGELARWTMMSRESLNKILMRWRDEGLVAQERGVLTLRDRERLEEIAEFGEEG